MEVCESSPFQNSTMQGEDNVWIVSLLQIAARKHGNVPSHIPSDFLLFFLNSFFSRYDRCSPDERLCLPSHD